MLFNVQLAFIICGNYKGLVEILSIFLDIKKTKGKKTVSFPFCLKMLSETRLKRTFVI